MALEMRVDFERERVLRSAVERAQKRYRLVGIGAAVAIQGAVVASGVAGHAQRGGSAIGLTDRWHIGSVTKPMTSTLVGLLSDEGRIDLDRPVLDVLPLFKGSMHASWNKVTMRHVLTHTHGGPVNLPRRTQFSRASSSAELVSERRTVLESILKRPLPRPPGSKFRYSNFGYILAGHVAEQLLDQSYEAIMQERVFAPLEMNSVGFGPTPIEGPVGHRRIFGFDRPVQHGPKADNGPAMSAAGRAHMSLTDLLTFGNDYMNAFLGESDALLTQQIALELCRVSVPEVNSGDYACGWVVQDRPGERGRMFWHNGSNTMWVAVLSVFPEEQTVMAFATNVGGIARSEQAFAQVTKEFLAGRG